MWMLSGHKQANIAPYEGSVSLTVFKGKHSLENLHVLEHFCTCQASILLLCCNRPLPNT